jgi:transposase-like protein
MMAERELELAHTTIMRWVQRYVPEFFRKTLRTHGRAPISITPDGYAASHRAVREMPNENELWKHTKL